MKKTSASLALLALAGGASAQSSVTLFGIADVGVSYYRLKSENVGAASPARPRSVTLSQTGMTSGNWVPSRWGFRGTEDLGGGLSAGFWIEAGASTKTSADYDGAMIGLTVPVGPMRIRTSYGYVKYSTDAPALSIREQDASISKFSLGMTYNLSKRTLLYATGAWTRIKDGQNNPTVIGVPPQTSGAYPAIAGYAQRSATGYDFGIAHTF